ncbi:hypothetical protein VE01_00165 [Pseudogymnoascus verrucosus]|uniref:Uncharacterized protein n=1 Tax=Pseudogymnoascus verrucosus TaxID=342668 RepID=A0A2P2SWU1_9PEZI|nr:uncharacterized protein VE01_00165 [Pseudogymnoascus verrucosus]OBU01264.1 hypothetical protein VE01_00165 [Pseudogymnoascus verrucosus]
MDTKSSRTRKIAQKPAQKATNKGDAKPAHKAANKDDAKSAHKAANTEEPKPAPSPEPPQTLLVDKEEVNLIDIRATGDILLDITFTNSHSTRTILALNSALPPRLSPFSKPGLPSDRTLFRVRLDTLTKTSAYFSRLLTDARFQEATKIASSFAALKARGVVPTEAQPADLPRVAITDDDDATHVGGRAPILADLLHILHSGDATSKLSIPYLAILAVMADRFDCAATVGRYVRGAKRVPWPQTYGTVSFASEELLRQKMLVAWLLEDRVKFAAATKECVFRGSARWGGGGGMQSGQVGVWWDLPDGIEAELHYRRTCILHTIASLQSHFIRLYSSRDRQCKMFYDSSAACDSFQLGEMVKFFVNKGIFAFTSPLLVNEEDYPEPYDGDIENLITALRQCPSYQYDKNHAHCGLRTRLIPALDFIQAMLASGVGIDRGNWKAERPSTSWESVEGVEPFRLTKSVATDSRLKLEGFLTSSALSKRFFGAGSWDWTPEE